MSDTLRRATRRAAAAFVALNLASCVMPPSAGSSPSTTTIPIPTSPPPSAASSTPTPSPRIGPAVVENVQLVAAGLQAPWAIDLAPDGRLFVTERDGRVRIVQLGPGGGLRAEPWATGPTSTSRDGDGELLVITTNRDGRGQPTGDDDRVLLVTLG